MGGDITRQLIAQRCSVIVDCARCTIGCPTIAAAPSWPNGMTTKVGPGPDNLVVVGLREQGAVHVLQKKTDSQCVCVHERDDD